MPVPDFVNFSGSRWTTQEMEFFYESVASRPSSRPGITVVLPRRLPEESVLAWVGRCQQVAVDQCLQHAARIDRDITLEPTERGYLVTHTLTGQRIEVATRQREVEHVQP